VQHYQAFATRLRANVLAPDYRGFADSTGKPSEEGLTIDTRAAWDWLRAHGASPDSVLVIGSSLGTGVAVQFAHALEEEVGVEAPRVVNRYVHSREHLRVRGENGNRTRGWGVAVRERPRGVVLLSPFSKLETLLDTYYILGLMPLFAPLRTIPYLSSESLILPLHSSPALPNESHEQKKKGTKSGLDLWHETGLMKKCIVHRFDSLAKVVVSAVLQGSVDSFPESIS